ncbi:YwiC-like family protein [Novipirellula aureliae]|uniref:YwiC-like family protein n=1 Tax=Novipirellula aureliae TaxID=2527966 RepID=UPI001E58BBE8|nr:YwiC-like family protein [Novipirellula aureliae]
MIEHQPKEHGAYAILIIPVLTSFAAVGVSWVGVFVAAASVAGFLAHEPLLVMIGHRGQRARRSATTASRYLLTLTVICIASGVASLISGNVAVRVALIGCVVLATLSFGVAFAGRHRTPLGQTAGVIGLSAPCVPILLAGGMGTGDALKTWVVWLLGFAATTLAVRSVIAFQKHRNRMLHWTGLTAISVFPLSMFVWWMDANDWVLPVIPMVLASWYLMIQPPPAKRLKQIGWSLVGATVLTAISVVVVIP